MKWASVVLYFCMALCSVMACANTVISSDSTTKINAFPTVQPKERTQQSIIEQKPDSLLGYVEKQLSPEDSATKTANHHATSDTYNPDAHQQLLSTSYLTGEYDDAFYVLSEFNTGLPMVTPSPNLQTPLATLEFFNYAIMHKKFGLAAYALNLNSIPAAEQTSKAKELVKKLDYLLSEKGLYVFDDLPDRADGLIQPPLGSSSPIKGVIRRSIKLGEINYKDRRVPLYLERIRVEDNPPIWVFSSQTVQNIEVLYDIHKPADFERYFPDVLTAKFMGMSVWEGFALLLFMLATLGFGFVVSKGVELLVEKFANHQKRKSDQESLSEQTLSLEGRGITDLLSKTTVPLAITISFALVFAFVSGAFPTVQAIATSTRPIVWILLVFSSLWLGIRIINFFANRFQDIGIDALNEDQFNKQRKRMTYLSVFRRIFIFTMVLGGIWISLAEFADLEGLGKTLLTSAGIAGAVIGIAAQPTLGNIIAGFQVALTQPIRIGDTIMLNDIWCEVEDLRYTYAVLKTWDDRRLIVPMKYFVTEVLENWSHTNIRQSSAVYLYVDYGADIDAINKKFLKVVKEHKLWDSESEPNLLVSAVSEETIKLRLKVSADSPANAWTLECEVRQQMLDYLATEHARHLPTERVTLADRDPNDLKATSSS